MEPGEAMAADDVLTPEQLAVLEFERSWFLRGERETKAAAIRSKLHLSATRYYVVLAGLVDSPAALVADPLLVRRLRRRRSERRRARVMGDAPRHRQPH